jgi:hypothetical protein
MSPGRSIFFFKEKVASWSPAPLPPPPPYACAMSLESMERAWWGWWCERASKRASESIREQGTRETSLGLDEEVSRLYKGFRDVCEDKPTAAVMAA